MQPEYVFETEMEVRDYECDIQGIVNNANYLHYTEHTRHLSASPSCTTRALIPWWHA